MLNALEQRSNSQLCAEVMRSGLRCTYLIRKEDKRRMGSLYAEEIRIVVSLAEINFYG